MRNFETHAISKLHARVQTAVRPSQRKKGGGRPKGSLNKKTLARQAEERARVNQELLHINEMQADLTARREALNMNTNI
jgi:hypothetical protein